MSNQQSFLKLLQRIDRTDIGHIGGYKVSKLMLTIQKGFI